MLDFDEIQHILLTRTPAITGRYEFLTFDSPEGGRAWLTELLGKVSSATDALATMEESDRWVTCRVHLDRTAGARGRRGVAGHLPRRVPGSYGAARGDPG